MLPLFDSHAHLGRVTHYDEHYTQIPVVIPGVAAEDTRLLRAQFPCARFATGVHPLWIGKESCHFADVETLLGSGGFCAIGECGFDRRAAASWEIQKQYFSQQIALAITYDLPVIVHLVGGLEIFLRCHQAQPFRGVLHSCTLAQVPRSLIDAPDIYFGFSARLPQNSRANQLFMTLPLERVLLESDADETVPATLPILEAACQRLATLRSETAEHVANVTSRNAYQLFGDCSKTTRSSYP
ncbi:TatD family hydrolase [Chrysiogenes arsenatis]|uniref:TatD family hydrolase n=1 Tax=Chrysiogenes arsenatis TaxID=309797 RepID=UPI00040DBFC3|nr:TatD family hydrolase [Chrysiogenes arsenatis]